MASADLFGEVRIEPEKLAKNRARPLPTKRYIIHFTPRSGSSWLTEVLTSARFLGKPSEWFNPNFIPNIANAVQAANLKDYVEAIQRHSSGKGVFGAEITAHQANAVFGSYDLFHDFFHDSTDFWLIRQDIVLQAVSLYKMVSTGVSHLPSVTPDDLKEADVKFEYDSAAISRWLRHIWRAEIDSESFFSRFDRSPIRICYELMTREEPAYVQNFFLSKLDIPNRIGTESISNHGRIRTEKNHEFAVRFSEENETFLAEVAEERQMRLAALRPLEDLLTG